MDEYNKCLIIKGIKEKYKFVMVKIILLLK